MAENRMQFDDLYSSNLDSFENQTKPLDQVIRQAFRVMLYETHTCLPVVVTKVINNSVVCIQPLLLTRLIGQPPTPNSTQNQGQSLQKQPIIQNVPVLHPRGEGYFIKLPVAVGDIGVAIFSERSLDNWKAGSGGFSDPNDTRAHHISDGIFIPGLYPTTNPITGNAGDMVLHNGVSELYLQKDGKFQVKNNENELLSLISELAGAVSDLADAVSSGFTTLSSLLVPGALSSEIDTANNTASNADTIKTSVEEMTGP